MFILILIFYTELKNTCNSDTDNDALLSYEGTDIPVPKRGYDWCSHTVKRSGACYKVEIGIKTRDICWMSGPHQPGIWNDVKLFAKSSGLGWILLNMLRPMMVRLLKHLQMLSVTSVSLALEKERG